MKTSVLFSLALSVLGSSVDAFNLADVKKTTSGSVVPGRYIVEFDSSAHLTSSGLKRDEGISTPHEAIYSQLKERGTDFTVHFEYSNDLFVGASITLDSDNDLANLLSADGIVDFRQVHLLNLPSQPVTAQSYQWPASSISNSTASKGPSSSTTSAKGFSVLSQIGAESVQAGGNKGKGVKIGIIDSGVDYTREPLGGTYAQAGSKVVGGYDFVGDSFDGTNDPQPDSDPFDNCYSHGTITAGLIGANPNLYGVTGVAPEASLYQYRVFGCNGATTDDIVLQAMQRAYTDGVDIINLSVGETSGWTESMLSVFASRLSSAGVVLSISAGNQGQVGAFYSYSPGAGIGVINVGSSDNAFYPSQLASVSTGYGPIPYFNYKAFASGTYPLYAFTTDPSVAADGCTIPDGTPNLFGYVTLVRRGGCSLEQKAKNIYLQGGRQMFLINTPNTVPLYQNFPLDFGMISYDDGNYLLSQINNHTSNTTVTFTFNPYQSPNTFTGNITSYFSEIGPTNDLYFAPSIVAPGTNMVVILPINMANWSIVDGTSYSAPLVAGSAALYINAKGGNNVSPDKVKAALQSTSDYLRTSVSDQSIANVAVQGAGKVNIANAISPGLVVSPSEILLNDTNYFAGTQYLTLTNPTNKIVTYKLSNLPAGTALAFQSGLNQSNDQPVPQVSSFANVRFSQSTVWLLPRTTWVVLLQFSAPTGLDAKQFPIYSGFIEISGGSNNVRVPYLGVASKMRDMPVLDPTPYYLGINTPTILDASGNVQSSSGQSYNFQNGSYPTVIYRLVGGTPLLLIDLIDSKANIGFTPNYNSKRSATPTLEGELSLMKKAFVESRKINSISGNNNKWWQSSKTQSLISLYCQLTNFKGKGCSGFNTGKSNTFAKVPILGNLFESDYIPRSTDNVDGQGNDHSTFALESGPRFANGTTIPNGTYKFLMRALHITGDRTKESDYEAWVSAPFTIAQ
uniref:Peptidase n=1 Tax=Kwoniella dejecticola CBS 10117 TaxID=1296121 RepID=A0A1A6A5P5_9TREE|nr:peptidase [Kwoniella dejecticola CBS 10117]OBR85374.1 peptidase [Kwoniella dejecticola CBS 10117]